MAKTPDKPKRPTEMEVGAVAMGLHQGFTEKQIAEAFGMTPDRVAFVVRKLRSNGFIDQFTKYVTQGFAAITIDTANMALAEMNNRFRTEATRTAMTHNQLIRYAQALTQLLVAIPKTAPKRGTGGGRIILEQPPLPAPPPAPEPAPPEPNQGIRLVSV